MKLCNCIFPLLLFFFFSLSLSSSSSSFISNPDFETLLDFKKSSDPFNKSLFSWSNSSNPCNGSWIGVFCNNENRVNRLVLQNLNLTGSIETLTQLNNLRLLSLKYNNLSFSSNFSLSSWKNMKLLYLSHNQFTGNFPSGISQLRRLRRLDLSYNQFSGLIPITQLTELPHLLTLRLEENSFTGSLILSSRNETFFTVKDFNVSRNDLFGEIPELLNSFQVSSFTGNKNLCGKPLSNNCANQRAKGDDPFPVRVPPEPKKVKKLSKKTILAITITYVLVIILMVFGIFILCIKRFNIKHGRERKKNSGYEIGFEGKIKEEDGEMVLFGGCLGIGVDDLLKSSAEMLGKGNIGTTYKVMMDNGDLAVVKRVRERKKKEVDGFLREIGELRNRNLVSLRGYYCSKDELLLVYDFHPNGSLHSLLHGNRGPGRTPLDWTTRLKFAAGAAEGLAFLHTSNKSKLSHGNLTSLNIVIDQENNPCISDAALYQLFLTPTNPLNNGYKAPELLHNSNSYRKFSQKCDVYSFGVILLEILTGKIAFYEGETSLATWVQCVVREEWTSEVFDIEILRDKDIEEQMVGVLQIALLCLAQVPDDRPKMSVVHKMIEDIKTRGIVSSSPPSADNNNNNLSTGSSPSHLSDDTAPTLNK